MSDTTFHLQIITPEAIIYDGEVKTVSGKNAKGLFDILPFHINFVSIIEGSVAIEESNGNKRTITINKAILKAYENYVHVFVGISDKNTS